MKNNTFYKTKKENEGENKKRKHTQKCVYLCYNYFKNTLKHQIELYSFLKTCTIIISHITLVGIEFSCSQWENNKECYYVRFCCVLKGNNYISIRIIM